MRRKSLLHEATLSTIPNRCNRSDSLLRWSRWLHSKHCDADAATFQQRREWPSNGWAGADAAHVFLVALAQFSDPGPILYCWQLLGMA
jgi:hypothetical protein